MFKLLSALALATVFSVPCLLSATSPTPSPLLGPGGVLEMHRQLFAAMDRGDIEAVKSFVDDERRDSERQGSVFLVDLSGASSVPAEAWGSSGMRDLLGRVVADQAKLGGEWKTTITKTSADCPSGAISFALLEIERARVVDGKTEAKKYLCTGLVHMNDGHWKLFHLHISPANATAATLAKK